MRRALAAALLLFAAAPAWADDARVAATRLPTCTDGAPFLVYVVDATAIDDCDATGGGTTEAPCLCLDGSYVAMLATGGGGGAPTSADYLVKTANGGLSAERVVTDTATVTWDWSTAGQAKANATDTDTKITLDLGDDGGNDSTALQEIAPVNDTYSVLTEPSADKLKVDLLRVPTYGELDFNRPPSSCFLCDEFTDGASDLTWAWGNQDSATVSLEADGLNLDSVNTNEYHARCIDTATHSMPVNSDQVFCAKVTATIDTATEICAIVVIEAGTIASPTEISSFGAQNASADGFAAAGYTSWALAGSASQGGINFFSYDVVGTGAVYLKMSYVDSTRALTDSFSFDGKRWQSISSGASTTLSADPVSWCVVGRNAANCFWDFVRLRTDASREECGQ